MAERKILIETMVVPPEKWTKEWVQDDGLKESIVVPRFDTFSKLVEAEGNEKLTELWRSSKEGMLQELLSRGKRLRVTGPGQMENARNQNGRIYTSALWDNVLREDSPFRRRLRERSVLGEVEHPESGNTKLHGHNNLGLSHLVEDVQRKDGTIYTTHLILNTPAGQIIKEYFDVGVAVAQSSRGSGSTRTEGSDEIVEAGDYVLDCWDFVYLPSVSIARTHPVESLQTSNGSKIFFVPVLENINMGTPSTLKESSDRTARARIVLESSGVYLNSKDVSLDGLLEHSSKINDCLAGLGVITESEFVSDVANLRGSLTNRSEEITRAVKRIREDEAEVAAAAPAPVETPKEETKPEEVKAEGQDEDVEKVLEAAHRRRNKGLQERYDTSIQLGETLVRKAREYKTKAEAAIKGLRKKVDESTKRSEAALKLLEAVVKRYRSEQVTQFVENLIAKNPPLKVVEKQLRASKTIKEAKSLVEGVIKPLLTGKGGKSYPSDLPPLNESSDSPTGPARTGTAKTTNLMESLVRKNKR